MNGPLLLDSSRSGHQSLGNDLPAKESMLPSFRVVSTKQVLLNLLQIKESQQFFEWRFSQSHLDLVARPSSSRI